MGRVAWRRLLHCCLTLLGPIGKLPAGGRNWEGFGSDPYLQGVGAYETIRGIQAQGVIATAKHVIGNEQEHFRQGAGAVSANIDDRTMHEVYLWPFQDSVKAGVGAVMVLTSTSDFKVDAYCHSVHTTE